MDDAAPGAGSGSTAATGAESSPDRVLAFTDGVFAIIITILVLEIGVPPDLSEQSLRQVVDELRPTLVAWVVSFLLTGMSWVAHRDLFARIRVVNRDLVWLNLLFLLPVCLIPFAASLLGEYPDEPFALHVYGAVLVLSAVMRVVLYHYVARRPALLREPPTSRSRVGLAISAAVIPVYLAAMLVADVSTTASVALFFSVPFLYFLLVTLLRYRPGTSTAADEFS